MSLAYFVALPFVGTEEGTAAGPAQEMPSEPAAVRRAEAMSKKPENVGALAFKRTGTRTKATMATRPCSRRTSRCRKTSMNFSYDGSWR